MAYYLIKFHTFSVSSCSSVKTNDSLDAYVTVLKTSLGIPSILYDNYHSGWNSCLWLWPKLFQAKRPKTRLFFCWVGRRQVVHSHGQEQSHQRWLLRHLHRFSSWVCIVLPHYKLVLWRYVWWCLDVQPMRQEMRAGSNLLRGQQSHRLARPSYRTELVFHFLSTLGFSSMRCSLQHDRDCWAEEGTSDL